MGENSPDLEWRDGVPVSRQFNDPYYSLDNGLAESRYVFLEGVDLHSLRDQTPEQPTVIGETGFGTGLNFLATWQWWQQHAPHKRLIFISAEAYPIDARQLQQAHAHFPELAAFSTALINAWPPQARGFHPIDFDGGAVKLLLLFDDAATALNDLSGKVDAWYLDGFAPARNPEMWTDTLFSEMAKHSKPGAKVATFTAAGFVRRGLMAAGFQMRKAPGFGRKRERLLGDYVSESGADTTLYAGTNRWAKIQTYQKPKTATIIGGGIAGASAAYALMQRGIKTTVIHDPGAPSSSGLPAAILVPRFMLQDQPEQRFFSAAFAHAVSHSSYQSAFSEPRGAYLLPKSENDQERQKKIWDAYGWARDWMDMDESGLYLPKSGTVQPEKLLSHLTKGCTHVSATVQNITQMGDGWRVDLGDPSAYLESNILILAAGPKSTEIIASIDSASHGHPELTANLGHLLIVDADHAKDWPDCTLSFGGYISATINREDRKPFRTVGSTFDRLEACPSIMPTPSPEARLRVQNQLNSLGPEFELPLAGTASDWAGIRATVPDHLPYCGPVPEWGSLRSACAPLATDASHAIAHDVCFHDGLYCLTGLGSKGFQYGPLLGEYLAAMICDEPLPIPKSLISKLHPARSMVREIIRTNSIKNTAP